MISTLINKDKRIQALLPKEEIEEDQKQLENMVNTFTLPRERSLVKGTIVYKSEDSVWVDIKAKSEGKIYTEEFKVKGFGQEPQIGDKVEVWLQATAGINDNQNTIVSFAKGAQVRAWKSLESSYNSKQPVDGIILGSSSNASGYIVSIMPYAARAFLPLSQIDEQSRSKEGINKLKTSLYPYMIVKIDRNGNSIIVSRKITNFEQDGRNTK